jgi:hypothetical protein
MVCAISLVAVAALPTPFTTTVALRLSAGLVDRVVTDVIAPPVVINAVA